MKKYSDINMKRTIAILSLFILVFCAGSFSLPAQSPEEIIAKMDQALSRADDEGCYMVMEMKIPIIGSIPAKMYMLGDKDRIETAMAKEKVIAWTDLKTSWTYSSKDNTITIQKLDVKDLENRGDDNLEMFASITDGYDVRIQSETPESWSILCKKSKKNKDKDVPKKMDLVVSKKTNLPISLKATVNGVSVILRDVSIGVDPKMVEFNQDEFPGAKIIDKR